MVRPPSNVKAANSSEFRRLHVAVFIPRGHVAFATRAARVDIYLLAQNEPLALGNPVLAICLSMCGFFVRAVERRAFAIHRFIAYVMTGHILGIIPVQYGVPLKVLCDKFSHTRFEPSGWSGNPEIGYAKSFMDYIFRWLGNRFLPPDSPPPTGAEAQVTASAPARLLAEGAGKDQTDAPVCKGCGAIMSPSGSCYRCPNCGSTSGA